jgi:NADPH2:quinone reductase
MALPDSMTAIAISRPGGPEVLEPVSLPVPQPGENEILVAVAAAGVNRPDVLQRQGGYPPPPGAPETPGLEIAGEVVAVGSGVRRYRPGDRVCALVAGGGYAEYCAVAEANALPIPGDLSMVEAAGLPETFFTVWTNVFTRGRLQDGEILLVHGGSSGIGTTAIMMAKVWGARVFTTAGSAEKCRACEDLGAERAINYREEDFVEAVLAATDRHGADVVLDMVGGEYVARNFKAAARDGRIVNIAFLQGSKVEINLLPLMLKRLTLTGSTLRPRSVEEKAEIARALEEHIWPHIAAGRIRPVIHQTFPLREAAAAHALMESGAHIGKIILEVAQPRG